MATKKKEFKFPAALGACADRLYQLQEKRKSIQKQADAVAEEETALKNHLIETLPKSKASGIAGKLVRVRIEKKTVPSVKDWAAFYKYVKRTGSFDLLQRRLAASAIVDRWDEGKDVPGVEKFSVPVVSMNKLK